MNSFGDEVREKIEQEKDAQSTRFHIQAPNIRVCAVENRNLAVTRDDMSLRIALVCSVRFPSTHINWRIAFLLCHTYVAQWLAYNSFARNQQNKSKAQSIGVNHMGACG